MEDSFVRNVILASRISDQAHGREILVSSLLKELTDSAGDIQFGALENGAVHDSGVPFVAP